MSLAGNPRQQLGLGDSHHARRIRARVVPNEAGMLLIASDFYFWNSIKAGMFMKTRGLLDKSRNVYENKGSYDLCGPHGETGASGADGGSR
jgi:hypothetical protein